MLQHQFVIMIFLFVGSIASARPIQRILFVGDSHCYGEMGKTIDTYLRTKADQVSSISVCGSSPSTWTQKSGTLTQTNCGYWAKESAQSETRVSKHSLVKFDERVRATNPDLVVIALGTNFMGAKSGVRREKKDIQEMIDQVHLKNAQCVWIGPPDLRRPSFKANLSTGVAELRSIVESSGCQFIDSTKITKYPEQNGDGIHYGPSASSEWGRQIVGTLERAWSSYGHQQTQKQSPTMPVGHVN